MGSNEEDSGEIDTPQCAWEEVERWAFHPGHVAGMNGWKGSEVGLGVCRSRPQAQRSARGL